MGLQKFGVVQHKVGDASFLGTPPSQVLAYLPGNRWASEPAHLWFQVSDCGPPTKEWEEGVSGSR